MAKWIIVGVVGLIGLLNMFGYLRAGFGKVRPGGPGFLAPRDKPKADLPPLSQYKSD